MSVFLMARASSTVLPFTHSVARDELAMADPQPKVLNLASSITWHIASSNGERLALGTGALGSSPYCS